MARALLEFGQGMAGLGDPIEGSRLAISDGGVPNGQAIVGHLLQHAGTNVAHVGRAALDGRLPITHGFLAAPALRTSLLAAAKVTAVLAPLRTDEPDAGPLIQLVHDELVNLYLSNENLASLSHLDHVALSPAIAAEWEGGGRERAAGALTSWRELLGLGPLARAPKPHDLLVKETWWITTGEAFAEITASLIEQSRGKPSPHPPVGTAVAAWRYASSIDHGSPLLRPLEGTTLFRASVFEPEVATLISSVTGALCRAATFLWSQLALMPDPYPSAPWLRSGRVSADPPENMRVKPFVPIDLRSLGTFDIKI